MQPLVRRPVVDAIRSELHLASGVALGVRVGSGDDSADILLAPEAPVTVRRTDASDASPRTRGAANPESASSRAAIPGVDDGER